MGARRTISRPSWPWSTTCPTTGRSRPFHLAASQMAYAAAAVLAGGHVRVGLEDNLWLEKGVLATTFMRNWSKRAVVSKVVERMGARVMTPAEVAREALGLVIRGARRMSFCRTPCRRHRGRLQASGPVLVRRFLAEGARVAYCDLDPGDVPPGRVLRAGRGRRDRRGAR